MTTLRGPAHPDEFRIKVGRNRERHYYDPLPGDDIAPATSDVWPSVSKVKNAASKDWSFVSIRRLADWTHEHGTELAGLSAVEVQDKFFSVNRAETGKAMERGTSIHEYLEAKAIGGFVKVIPDAAPYIPAVEQFLADCQPEWLLSEVVIINRTIGYGGSADAISVALNIPGMGRMLVDWKTRTSAEQHAAYDEECWQVGGAYFHGEYMIVDDGGQAKRVPMPELDGALIVSLAPEGYKLYPIDVEKSWEAFKALAGFDKVKHEAFAANPLHVPRAVPAAFDESEVKRLEDRVIWIKTNSPEGLALLGKRWPTGVPTFKAGGPTTADQCSTLAAVIADVEKDASVAWNPADEKPAPELSASEPRVLVAVADPPDEGELTHPAEVEKVARRIDALDNETKLWLSLIVAESAKAGGPLRLKETPYGRRVAIVGGLLDIARVAGDETVKALAAAAADDDQLTAASVSAGAAVAALDWRAAFRFSELCRGYAEGAGRCVAGPDGVLRFDAA